MNQKNHSLESQFEFTWCAIGAKSSGLKLYKALVGAYSESHRKYHSIQHLTECLQAFDSARRLAKRPAEVELALWFHDAIYDVKRSDNEEQSANWARRELEIAAVPTSSIERVFDLVMVTKHTGVPEPGDQQLLVDIDLSILGAPPERFAEYEQQIRAEYSFVPRFIFRSKRRAILNSFLNRQRIYATDHFYSELEQRARQNLARAIA